MTTQPLPFSLVLNDACDGYHLSFGKTKLRDCRIAVATPEIETEYAVDLELSHHGGASIVKGHSSLGIVTLNVAPKTDADAVGVVLSSQLDLTRPCRWLELAPLAAVHVSDVSHVLCHGRSMGGCQLLPLGQGTPRTEFESHFQCMLTCDSHRRLHLSHPLMQQHPSSVRGLADEGGVHELRVPTRMEFPTPGCLQSESLTLLETRHGFAAMTAWADSQQVSPLPDTPQPAGWNSWDYYRWTITEDEVLANADFIASDPVLSRHVKRIIVDDGWQYCHGEWEANSLFPSGMASLAQKLRGMGFIPGLWFAPTIAEPHSRIAQWHTHMLARAESDKPCICFDCMRRYGFSLDPTREDVKQWLYDLFDRYASMGYGYFKLDFLRTTLKARRFHRNVPRGTMMREIVTPIAAAVEGRADLLGCNYSYDGGNDLVRMVRAGSDIHATWGETKRNVVALAARFWAGNRLI